MKHIKIFLTSLFFCKMYLSRTISSELCGIFKSWRVKNIHRSTIANSFELQTIAEWGPVSQGTDNGTNVNAHQERNLEAGTTKLGQNNRL